MGIKCPECKTENTSDSQFCKKCATPLTDLSGKSISQTRTLQTPSERLIRGTHFADRYEIIEKLGEGGMGAVYRVEDTKVREEVALKLISPRVASEKQTIERFRNELKFARKIRHKHVCQMFDLGEDEGTHFITMEYVAGEDLKNLLRRTDKLTIEMAIRVAKQVADGLAEAHRIGIVHRDLKPSNIMIDNEGEARIMDFGIARSTRSKGITGAGLVIGTPEYMSPEQAEGKEADSRSDIYSLGVIFFEMLTGQRPFEGDSALGIAMKHKGEEPQEPRLLNPNISDSINELVLKCLKKNPDDRYQNIEELRDGLSSIDMKLPAVKTRGRQISGLISKEITVSLNLRKFLVPGLVFILVIVAGLFIWRPWGEKIVSDTPSGKPTLAIVYFKNISGVNAIDIWKTHFSEFLMIDIGQSKHINVLDPVKTYSILQDLDLLDSEDYSESDLMRICEEGHASHILRGFIRRSEGKNKVDATLYRADTLESLGSENVEGTDEDEIDVLVDQMTLKIKNLFGLTETQISEDIDMRIGVIRPKSEEAYELYSRGLKTALVQSEYESAIQMVKMALDIEPDFAYGYLCLATFYFNTGRSKESKLNTEKALELYAKKELEYDYKISVKEKNIALAKLNTYSEATLDKCFDYSREILKYYPDNLNASDNLAFYNYVLENWDESITYYNHMWKLGFKDSWIPYKNLAFAYSANGLYDKAEEGLQFILEYFPDESAPHGVLALIHLCQKEHDQALLELEASSQLPTSGYGDWAKGVFLYCREDFEDAIEAFEEQKNQTQDLWFATDAFMQLHNTCIAQGRFEEARVHLKRGISFAEKNEQNMYLPNLYFALMYNLLEDGRADDAIDVFDISWEKAQQAGPLDGYHMRRLLYIKGIALLVKEDSDEARKIVVSLKELIESGKNPKAMKYFFHLSGLLEQGIGNIPAALDYYHDALELIPYEFPDDPSSRSNMAPYLESLGIAYFNLGELDKAIEQFEKIQALTVGRLFFGDIYAKSYYTMGKIFEQKAWRGKAIECFEKFLDLWKNADPDIPEVDDAKNRLARLTENE